MLNRRRFSPLTVACFARHKEEEEETLTPAPTPFLRFLRKEHGPILNARAIVVKLPLDILANLIDNSCAMKTIHATLMALAILAGGNVLNAQVPQLYARDGTYLGNLSANRFDPNSVANPVGIYGSRVSPYSVNNPVGLYGSSVSPYSANNPMAVSAPVIVVPNVYGR